MELLKGLIGQGLELAIHEDGVHLLVGSDSPALTYLYFSTTKSSIFDRVEVSRINAHRRSSPNTVAPVFGLSNL